MWVKPELAVAPLVHLLLNFLLYTQGGGKHTHNRRALAVVSASLVTGRGQLYAALCMSLAVFVVIGTHCHLE